MYWERTLRERRGAGSNPAVTFTKITGGLQMYKCGWSHCEKVYIYDTDEKTKVGKRWYHAECAKERETIKDIIKE